jgi:hypothetical protein
MADIKESLIKKLGPLPVYAWGGLVVVAIVGYMLYKRHQTSASTATAAGTSTTAASTLPSSATTGYVISGDNGGSGWQGYNNNGSNATTSTSSDVYTAITSGAEALGLANANYPLYENPAPGIYTPYTGGAAGILNAIKLGWATNAAQLYYINPNPTSATTPTATPAVAAAATAPVTAVNTPVANSSNPASAIAPSALSGPTIPATPAAAPLSGPAALAAAQAGTPLYSSTGVPYTGGIAGIQNAIKLGWAKYAEPLYAAA